VGGQEPAVALGPSNGVWIVDDRPA
jgi:hypothetical protein